jgi:tRNA (adenine57-N1/adenine58-N1)-methyltransferase
MLGFYKTVPARLRPVDRMVAHTGYLVFARALLPGSAPAELEAEVPSALDGPDAGADGTHPRQEAVRRWRERFGAAG